MKKAPINWTNVVLFSLTPLFAVTLVPLYGLYYGYEWFEWLMFVLLMGVCGMSITAGYHRLWAHKAYRAHPVLRVMFAVGGAFALQNDILHWASDHRRHHRHVDDNERDPYSAKRGLWFSHIGWILRDYPSGEEDFSNVKDLLRDPVVVWQARYYLPLVLLTNIGLPLLLGLLYGDIIASLLLAGLLRLVLSHHFTWLINSLAHKWGVQPYSKDNTARDNSLLALFTYGEGYHNYHHAFQWDYRMGIKWWHFDPTKWMIRVLSWFRLTGDLKRSTPAQVEKTRVTLQYQSATERCEMLDLPQKIRQHLQQEYEQLLHTLQLWTEHRQAWYEAAEAAKDKHIQKTLEQWDRLALKDRYQEVQFRLRTQRRRWRRLIRNLHNPAESVLAAA
ncbi:MAG: acyl-CoA desaturase [Pseudohongiellaceae bacterium]